MTENIFKDIRKNSKFCTICGGKLDFRIYDWHLPYCIKCRKRIHENAIKAMKASKRLKIPVR